MKNKIVTMIVSLLISTTLFGQDLTNLDFISPFHDGLAAVRSGEQWGFINESGDLVVDFRNDLVIGAECPMKGCTKDMETNYPIFNNGRSLIQEVKDGITHYGYINTNGKIVIEPSFINATHFNEKGAIVLKVIKENLGRNEILGKNVISYSYNEVIIDKEGNTAFYLRGPFNLVYSKEKLKSPPKILSKFLNPELIAVQSDNERWKVQVIDKN